MLMDERAPNSLRMRTFHLNRFNRTQVDNPEQLLRCCVSIILERCLRHVHIGCERETCQGAGCNPYGLTGCNSCAECSRAGNLYCDEPRRDCVGNASLTLRRMKNLFFHDLIELMIPVPSGGACTHGRTEDKSDDGVDFTARPHARASVCMHSPTMANTSCAGGERRTAKKTNTVWDMYLDQLPRVDDCVISHGSHARRGPNTNGRRLSWHPHPHTQQESANWARV